MEGVTAAAVGDHLDVGAAGDAAERFTALCGEVEPGLRRALVAWYGPDVGADAAADALAWAWEHLDKLDRVGNRAGYLWRVGQSSARRQRGREAWPLLEDPVATWGELPPVEPGLMEALAELSPRQRTAVLLVYGHGYSLAEAAGQMDCRIRTLRNHLERGLTKLRQRLGVIDDG